RTSSGPSDAGGNPPPVTIHTWPERFNKQKPHSFEKAIAPVDAENWISHMEKIFDVMGSAGTEEEQAKNFQWGLRSNNNYSGSNNRLNFKSIQSSSTHERDPNITA
nr:zinc finger, CCHC-type, retrotransposon Gag domain protein [Tanacetum cinerariifolium]